MKQHYQSGAEKGKRKKIEEEKLSSSTGETNFYISMEGTKHEALKF